MLQVHAHAQTKVQVRAMMRRRGGRLALGAAAGTDGLDSADPSPMESVSNLSDVMLVLAVSLMIMIIARLGVTMSDVTALDEDALQPIDASISESSTESSDGTGAYEEVGTVYRDIETGELYVVGN